MDLFDYARQNNLKRESPLASRMRPTSLEEVVGQEHIIGRDKLLYRAIAADKLSSIILYGPPGVGKTTIAQVIAHTTMAEFTELSATAAGKKDMEEAVKRAEESLGMYGARTILFIDEIHRFNKSQQDFLLPYVENGTVILIGATTENPYFEVNSALISRSLIFELKPLSRENIITLLKRALSDEEKGLGAYNAYADDEALDFLANYCDGDARSALNGIELAVMTTPRDEDGRIHITLEVAGECIQHRVVRYDKTGDNHYDTISAFIKSMRGSDPDAAIFYLAKMLYDGEDIKFIARRMMICASVHEDFARQGVSVGDCRPAVWDRRNEDEPRKRTPQGVSRCKRLGQHGTRHRMVQRTATGEREPNHLGRKPFCRDIPRQCFVLDCMGQGNG